MLVPGAGQKTTQIRLGSPIAHRPKKFIKHTNRGQTNQPYKQTSPKARLPPAPLGTCRSAATPPPWASCESPPAAAVGDRTCPRWLAPARPLARSARGSEVSERERASVEAQAQKKKKRACTCLQTYRAPDPVCPGGTGLRYGRKGQQK